MVAPVDQWRDALLAMPPREAAMLERLWVEGAAPQAVREAYGMSAEAFDVHVFRALRALQATRLGVPVTLLADEVETAEARVLTEALASRGAHPLVDEVAGLTTHAEALQQALRAARIAAESGPARRREDRLRSIGFWSLLVVSALLYWQHEAPQLSLLEFAKSLPSRLLK